ncbi:hypothetical protein DL770_001647 [Monosporascus sp. CRB-9-2]|nr:hypothetical protein DL770_001647 [Monosporascus sp. CRB-9-2]
MSRIAKREILSVALAAVILLLTLRDVCRDTWIHVHVWLNVPERQRPTPRAADFFHFLVIHFGLFLCVADRMQNPASSRRPLPILGDAVAAAAYLVPAWFAAEHKQEPSLGEAKFDAVPWFLVGFHLELFSGG